ncbi:SphA family protein [Microbulbifer hainanensis]|uniref:SphA family protein n=1 Tax=Microbulbifer hainanensis TaxID=2735675 RepID=UPI0029C07837|nr:transporter [Microbulbifer hainanensis]
MFAKKSAFGALHNSISQFILGCALLAAAATANATEGGIGYYVPGTTATLIDRAPLQTGWVVEPMYLHYSGDFGANVNVPIAGVVAAGIDVDLDAVTAGALYTFDKPVLGAKYTAGAYLSWVDVKVTGSIETAFGNFGRRSHESGLGDTTLIPAMLGWQKDNWQYNALLTIHAPTGDYKTGRLANPGLNYWAVDPSFGVAYSNQASGFNATLFAGLTYNWENPDTDYQSGTLLHLDGSVQQMVKVGSGFLTLGLNAFYLNQVSDDEHPGRIVGEFRQRSSGIGPVIGYVLPKGRCNLLLEFRWLPQLDTKNTTEGDYYWLKLVYQF